jgi:hypothetical protein
MAERSASDTTGGRLREADAQAMESAQAQQAGSAFQWHYGRVTRMGTFEGANASTRGVTILWEEGGISSQQGTITDDQWEIVRLAFVTTGRIAVLSDQPGEDWMYDYRFLEAVR